MFDPRFTPVQEPPARSVTVTRLRRDGKYQVTYHFPLAGRSMDKIRTREQVLADRASGYDLRVHAYEQTSLIWNSLEVQA